MNKNACFLTTKILIHTTHTHTHKLFDAVHFVRPLTEGMLRLLKLFVVVLLGALVVVGVVLLLFVLVITLFAFI